MSINNDPIREIFARRVRPVSRRGVLRSAACGLGTIGLANLLAQSSPLAVKNPHYAPRAKRVIFLFMHGGPSQLDLFDHKPALAARRGEELPDSVRGTQRLTGMTSGQKNFPVTPTVFQFARHGASGMWVSDLLPHPARITDELCVIRSLHTEAINHDPAVTMLQTGHQQPGRPSFGAWTSYGLGSVNRDLPGFVVLNGGMMPLGGVANWSSGFLPARHEATQFNLVGGSVMENLAGGGPAAARAKQLAFISENDRAFAASSRPGTRQRSSISSAAV